MGQPSKYVVFLVAEQQHGLPLEVVRRVVRMVRVTHLPHPPAGMDGVINIQGQAIPVLNFRRWLGLPTPEPELTDRLLIVETPQRPLALIVDDVLGVIETSAETNVPADEGVTGAMVDGLIKLETNGAFIVLHSVTQLLSGRSGAEASPTVLGNVSALDMDGTTGP